MIEPRYRIRVARPDSPPNFVCLRGRNLDVTGFEEQAYTASRPTIEATLRAFQRRYGAAGYGAPTIEEAP